MKQLLYSVQNAEQLNVYYGKLYAFVSIPKFVCTYVLLIMTVDSCKPFLCPMDSVLSHLLDHMLACVTNVPPTRSLHGGPPLLSC